METKEEKKQITKEMGHLAQKLQHELKLIAMNQTPYGTKKLYIEYLKQAFAFGACYGHNKCYYNYVTKK